MIKILKPEAEIDESLDRIGWAPVFQQIIEAIVYTGLQEDESYINPYPSLTANVEGVQIVFCNPKIVFSNTDHKFRHCTDKDPHANYPANEPEGVYTKCDRYINVRDTK